MFEHLFDLPAGATSTPAPAGHAGSTNGREVAMRKYDDPVEVRRGRVEGGFTEEEGPEQFLWRGRLWKVRTVLAHWVETGPWWQSSGVRAVVGTEVSTELDHRERSVETPGDLLAERELWRVEAGRGAADAGGVFDLSFSWDDGRWQLVGCAD